MNLEKQGLLIAKVRSKTYDKNFTEIPIYITDDNKVIKQLKHKVDALKISVDYEDDEILQHMPYQDLQNENTRQILYVSGASGSGKSYYTAGYIKEYTKMFPKNKIILFSSVLVDKKLDVFKNLIRVKLDEEFYNKKFTIDDFKDSLVIYDDCEAISNAFIQEKLTNIMNLLLTTGRHKNVFMIITSHNTTDRSKGLILKEAHSLTIFVKTLGKEALRRVLENHFGLDMNQINTIRKLDSRWITILKTYPMSVLHEKGIYVLNND
jgi:hypothetical protein